ncbi:polysialic acid transporter [Pseudomaricurvus alkylphenolicus]|nr:polysialic acid transporter [Pseudomaricurvus alkylphenolicus]
MAALFATFFLVDATHAKESYAPYIESLAITQFRQARASAPQGQDQPLSLPDQTIAEQKSGMPSTMEESRLEVIAEEKSGPLSLAETQQDQIMTSDLSLFGYDIFSDVPTTFAPVEGIPVPASYIIGPGDTLIVQLYGKLNVEYKLVVTRDGHILIPEYGPVKVAGLGFDESERLITEGFERRVIGVRAVVTMGALRTVQIRLAGDVVKPGIYTVGGLSTLIDALLSTGGVQTTGSLRNIQLIRGSERVANLDLYDLLLKGHSGQDIYLAHNDTIFVPPIGPVVYVGGEVQRPAIYELRGETSVGQMIDMAGGLLPTASLKDSHIERIEEGGFRSLLDFSNANDEMAIRKMGVSNGDFLRVLALEDQLRDVVLLSGQVQRPGGYQYREGMRISDLIDSARALLPGADMEFLLIKREQRETLLNHVLYTNLLKVLETPGGEADLLLQPRDQVQVFNLAQEREKALASVVRNLELQATDYRPARVVELRGALRFSGRLPLQEGARLLDVVALGGGLSVGADLHYGVLARTRHPSSEVEIHSFSLRAARQSPTSEHNPFVSPGDRLYFFFEKQARSSLLVNEVKRLREQARYGADENLVTILGEVQHGGVYPRVPEMRASDLLCAAGGLTRKANGVTAELSRVSYRSGASANTEHMSLDSQLLLRICLLKRQLEKGRRNRVEYQALYDDDRLNPRLTPLDQMTFSRKSGWLDQASVTVSGEVRHPGVYTIERGETLCQLLKRAGGLTSEAYPFGAVFTRESVRAMQQQTIDQLHAQLDNLMVELSLSHSFNNRDKSSHEWGGKQDYLKAIQQLERAEANGRLVVDLKRHSRCRRKDLLRLEPGDSLSVPRQPDYVQVTGQVYVPTSHRYEPQRRVADYLALSGGPTVIGKLSHAYVIQANGEVLSHKGSRISKRIARNKVMPGARIYVPLNVDRMNATEKAQTWVQTLVNSAILAGVVL